MTDIANPVVEGQETEEEVFVFPVSFAQQRLWFFDRLQPGDSVYNMPLALRVLGPLRVEPLARAVEEVVRRHESLRTTFTTVDRQPVQVVSPHVRGELRVVSLEELPEGERMAEARRRVSEETSRPFDLERGPLFTATLYRLATEEHVLLFNMHHIVSDGWSLGVLLRETHALYDAFSRGEPSPLPELPLQYADFTLWQREVLSGETLERQLRWWTEHFEGAPPLLELPLDRPRPPVQTYRGASHAAALPPALVQGLSALARGEGATLFMALLAGFNLLLSRYARQDRVVVGTPIAGRTQPETEGLVGFFVNTLAVQTDLGGDPTFRGLLRRVRDAMLGAYAHQDFPFERLVDELKLERSLSYSPLFQVMFNLLNTPDLDGAHAPTGTRFAPLEYEVETEKYDLTLSVAEGPDGGAWAGASYNPDLFDAATVERMMGHFRALLESAVATPDAPLSRLEMMGAEERRQVTEEWNRAARPFPSGRCIHHLFEEHAARTPDAPALRREGRVVTYGELNGWANRIARRLRALGVQGDDRVAVSMERGPEVMAALLGVLKAGAAYVPVDPAYPAERRAYLLEDSGARVVVTQPALAASLPATGARVLAVEAEVAALSVDGEPVPAGGAEEAENPGLPVDADGLAYVIYTSGSTGLPKGVMVPHRGVVNLAGAAAELYGLGPDSRMLQFASFSFDASVMEWASAFAAGASLVLSRREELVPGPALVERLEREGVTDALLPPSVLAVLPETGMPALRSVITGGEACAAEVAARWAATRCFFNAYGPTEASVASSIGQAAGEMGQRPSIGAPLPNTRSYVLDEALRPVPVGVPGELFVGGAGVTRGYLGRPGLTAERYLPDPFSGEPGARMYGTGDLVRWLPDGRLDYLRRLDDQVKVRGFRIELGEIGATVRAHSAVRDAAVIVREDRPGDKRITAYFVGAAEGAPSPAELRAFVAERLPEHMVPSFLVPLEAIPLTTHGKLDRRALPEPEGGATAAHVFVAASGETEETLAAVWREVLGTERVGVNDNFFELGGHSLLLAQVQVRLREVMERDVAMVDLFRFPTVRSLAQHLSGGGEETAASLAEKAQEKADARRAARSGRRDRRR
jgi:amino acid adenylation domain-containing protein